MLKNKVDFLINLGIFSLIATTIFSHVLIIQARKMTSILKEIRNQTY